MTTGQLVIAILGSASIAGAIGAFITGIFSKRKLGAEATEIISRAAAQTVESLTADNNSLRRRIKALEDRQNKQDEILAAHATWDYIAIEKLHNAGIHLPKVPPMRVAPDGTLDE